MTQRDDCASFLAHNNHKVENLIEGYGARPKPRDRAIRSAHSGMPTGAHPSRPQWSRDGRKLLGMLSEAAIRLLMVQ
jgi:hypothetical protein